MSAATDAEPTSEAEGSNEMQITRDMLASATALVLDSETALKLADAAWKAAMERYAQAQVSASDLAASQAYDALGFATEQKKTAIRAVEATRLELERLRRESAPLGTSIAAPFSIFK